jgi:hypothetical protein
MKPVRTSLFVCEIPIVPQTRHIWAQCNAHI